MGEETSRRSSSRDLDDSFSVAETRNQDTRHLYEFGPYRLDPNERKLLRNNEIVELPPKAFDTLVLMVRNSGHLMEKDELIRTLWPDSFVEEGSLSNSIFLLRKALGEDPQYIETVPKRGYRFVGAVRCLRDGVRGHREVAQFQAPRPAVDAAASEALPRWRSRPAPSDVPAQQFAPQVQDKARSRRWVLPLAGATVMLIAVALFAMDAGGLRSKILSRSAAPPQIRSLAVLPLANLTSDPQQEYLADGITEELISGLSQLSGLRVISRTSVMQYKGEKKKSLSQIGHELNVDAVLEGSVLRSGNRVRIKAHMLYAPTEQTLMTETFDRDLEDVLKLQGDVAAAITKQIGLRLTADQYARLHPTHRVNSEAMEDYLKALQLDWSIPQQNKQAQDYLREAISKDPNCAEAYVALASAQETLGQFRLVPPGEAYGPARQLLRKAAELDDKNCWAYMELAQLDWRYEWNWKDAEKEFRIANQRCPNEGYPHWWLGYYSAWAGRKDEALAEISKYRELNPALSEPFQERFQEPFQLEATVNYHLRNYKGLAEVCRKYVISEPDNWVAYYWLGVGLEGSGQTVEAIPQYQKSVELSQNNSDAVASLAYAYATTGKGTEAQKILDDFFHQSETEYVSPYMIAVVYAGLGNKDKAFENLEKAYQERSPDLPYFLRADLRMDTLRSDPRFQDLMRRMNFPQ